MFFRRLSAPTPIIFGRNTKVTLECLPKLDVPNRIHDRVQHAVKVPAFDIDIFLLKV